MSTEHVMDQLREFARQRNWEQFHSPENLAKSISIEAAELLECFQWSSADNTSTHSPGGFSAEFQQEVGEELADVMTYCLYLAMRLDMDPEKIILDKLATTGKKYPVDKAFGQSDKYDRL